MHKRYVLVLFSLVLLMALRVSPAAADLTLNLVGVNPKDEVREIEIKYYLPDDISNEDVLDSGELQIDYDVEKETFFVYGNVKFKPKESKTFKIKVKDIWMIDPQEVVLMKEQLVKNMTLLDPAKDDMDAAEITAEHLDQQLDYLLAQQTKLSDNIDRRIEQYRAYREKLDTIRDQVYSVDFLRHDSKALEELKRTQKDVTFILEVTNPRDELKTLKHKHYLPLEVRETDVLEGAGFDIRYDERKGKSYLIKEEEFKPNEMKRFEIKIRDIWQFPIIKVEDLTDRALIAQGELMGTVFEQSANFLMNEIVKELDTIRSSIAAGQNLPPKEHIGLYRTNQARFEAAMRDFRRIEEMIAIVRAKKLEKYEQTQVKNVLQKLKALRGLTALSEALFKRGISVTVTWRIIFGTIIFVGLFTTLHFMIWSKRSKTMGEELASSEGIKEVPKPGEEKDEEKE